MRTIQFLFISFILSIANVGSCAQTPAYKLLTIFTAKTACMVTNKTNISIYKDVAWTYYADELKNKRDEAIDG